MAETALTKKLLIKPGNKLLTLNAPEYFHELIGELPSDTELSTQATPHGFDIVISFVANKTDATQLTSHAIESLKAGGILWFVYPKQTAKNRAKTDINRDHGWEALNAAGFTVVTAISLDNTWSALRFRPNSEIKVLTRKTKDKKA